MLFYVPNKVTISGVDRRTPSRVIRYLYRRVYTSAQSAFGRKSATVLQPAVAAIKALKIRK